MSDNLYRSYFRMLMKMGKTMREKECYPIQYIIATTTMPISNEDVDGFVPLHLHGRDEENLLFKKRLHEVGEGLFIESSSKGESL